MARRHVANTNLVIWSSRHLVISAAAIAQALFAGVAAQKAVDGDCPMYNRDLAGTRHSPLKQINAANVGTLGRTGDIAWKVPLGVTDELPEGKKNTGRLNLGGPITTAGGLVFIGAANDKRFRAFDEKTGKELWVARLALSAHAVPITYQGRNGEQYVAITASGSSALDDPAPEGSEALVVFSLP